MYYIVLSQSGWQNEEWGSWDVRGTFPNEQEANDYAASIKTDDSWLDGYRVQVRCHEDRKMRLSTDGKTAHLW